MLGEIVAFIRRNGMRAVVAHALELYIGVLIRWLPGVEGLILRGLFYRCLFRRAGKNLLIYPGVYIIFSHRLYPEPPYVRVFSILDDDTVIEGKVEIV